MEVINEVYRKEIKEISDTLKNILSNKTEPEFDRFPFIFAIKYSEDANSKDLVPHYMFGILKNPTILHNSLTKGDNAIYLSMALNEYFCKIGTQKGFNKRGDMTIPGNLKIVDVDKIIEDSNHKDISNIEVPKSDNILNLYLGDAAFSCFEKINEFKD
jgi:hypothetical protein